MWRVEQVRGSGAVIGRLGDWRAALQSAATEGLFLEPEWVLPWLSSLGSGEIEALFATHSCGSTAAAILVRQSIRTLPDASVLTPPGLGVSDYLDLLLPEAPGLAEPAVEACLDSLLTRRDWALLDLPNLPDESGTADLIEASARRRGLRSQRFRTHLRPYLPLAGDWESFLRALPAKQRYNLRSRLRRLQAAGPVQFHHYRDPEEVEQALVPAFELHAKRWRGQRSSTVFSASTSGRDFYREACALAASRGRIDLATLEQGDRQIAFALCIVRNRRLYYYIPAFDPDFSTYGPSSLLLAHLIESAYQRGLTELDFMLGDESYKTQWTPHHRGTSRLLIAAPGKLGLAALSIRSAALGGRLAARRSPLLRELWRHGLRGLPKQWPTVARTTDA